MSKKTIPIRYIFRRECPKGSVAAVMRDVFRTYNPQGRPPLNRTEWMGMPARSCSIQRVFMGRETDGKIQIEVEYRPDDWVSYVADTRYVGWTAYLVNRSRDGKLLDQEGNPLADGADPVMLPFEVYPDIDFNDLEFGELLEEVSLDEDQMITFSQIMANAGAGGFQIGSSGPVAVAHRSLPSVKIVLSESPTGIMRGGFGEQIHNINAQSPHLKQVVAEEVITLVRGLLEGRYEMAVVRTPKFFMIDLTKLLVDASGEESRFDCLLEYLPEGFLVDLANRISARYRLQAKPVLGDHYGLLLNFDK